MKLRKEFSYTDIGQRRLLLLNTIITFFLLGITAVSVLHNIHYYEVYRPVFKNLVIIISVSISLGNLFSWLLMRCFGYRIVYIVADLIIVGTLMVFFLKSLLSPYYINAFQTAVIKKPAIILFITGIVPFAAGIKIHYFLKVLCGNFIDDSKGVISLLTLSTLSLLTGMLVYNPLKIIPQYFPIIAILLLPLLLSVFIIRLPYHSSPQVAHETGESADQDETPELFRDDTWFTYLNFSFVTVYAFLGYLFTVRLWGNYVFIQYMFLTLLILSFMGGFLLARLLKNAFWFIYSEMLFPLSFLGFFLLIMIYVKEVNYYGMLFFAIPGICFGFSIYKTILNVILKYGHVKRFKILNISILMLPVPLILSLSLVRFTSFWYFIFLYSVMLINIVLPGLFLLQKKISAIKKTIYTVFSLFFVPGIILFHIYFSIPFDSTVFITHTEGFNRIYERDAAHAVVSNDFEILHHGRTIFDFSECTIRNMKRALFPVYMYNSPIQGSRVLFLDGNQKFFHNPIISAFSTYKVVDYLPEYKIDNNRLPLKGREDYLVDAKELLTFIFNNEEKYASIVDSPNIYDQDIYRYRFTGRFYSQVKKHLIENGLFAQIINIKYFRKDFLSSAIHGITEEYRHTAWFLFSNMLVLMGTDDNRGFNVDTERVQALGEIIAKVADTDSLFINQAHFLSYMMKRENINRLAMKDATVKRHFYTLYRTDSFMENPDFESVILENNVSAEEITNSGNQQIKEIREILNSYKRNEQIFKKIKIAEMAGARQLYEKEAEQLVQLIQLSRNERQMGEYLEKQMIAREQYYFKSAIEYEKEKKWDEAKKLYSAIITINGNNFEANYRMGLLCLTLQNIEESFKYIQKALQLQKDDPRVQYQMGVLLFSSGREKESLEYLERSITLKNDMPSVYFYLGLAYEKTGNVYEAKKNYERAMLRDPNDEDIKLSIERIAQKIQEEQEKWKQKEPENQNEDEKGENIPLPINKSAYEWRITDEQAKRMKPSE